MASVCVCCHPKLATAPQLHPQVDNGMRPHPRCTSACVSLWVHCKTSLKVCGKPNNPHSGTSPRKNSCARVLILSCPFHRGVPFLSVSWSCVQLLLLPTFSRLHKPPHAKASEPTYIAAPPRELIEQQGLSRRVRVGFRVRV